MAQVFPTLKTPIPEPNTASQVDVVNQSLQLLDQAYASATAQNATTTAPPGSPGDEAYIVAATATGDWAGSEDYLALYRNGWLLVPPMEGWVVWLLDEGHSVRYTGTAWVEHAELGSVAAALTASTTQSQGQQPLTAVINQVGTCATASDVVTLPTARAGLQCIIANDGAETLQVFPASGNAIDALVADASTTIAAAGRSTFIAISASAWIKL